MNGDLNRTLAEIGRAEGLGRAVAQYGVRLAIDMLQTLLADLEGTRSPANAAQFLAGLEVPAGRKKRGRPRSARKTGTRSGWPDDPVERKAEAKRRAAVRKANAQANAQRNSHSEGTKKAWAAKTPAQRKAWSEAIQQARKARINGAAA